MITSRKHKQPKSSPSASQPADLFALQSPQEPQFISVHPSQSPSNLPASRQPLLSDDEITVLQSLIEEAGQAETISVSSDGLSGAGVSHLDSRSCARMTRGLLLFCNGLRWREIAADLGITWAVWDAWTGPKAAKKVANVAMERKDKAIFQEILASAQDEAIKDTEEYVIGRVGKDEDGILRDDDGSKLKKKRPNTKMRELFLKAHDPRFRNADGNGAGGAGTAKQITYNINVVGNLVAHGPQAPQPKPIDADFRDTLGENRAEKSPFG